MPWTIPGASPHESVRTCSERFGAANTGTPRYALMRLLDGS